ncbi:hypothetical protein VTK73DRAFT_8490 [Phialemonium thermophilum]|uniref:diphosphoinositol-polyphosphate diphosphatase n=1 Tax=Phialemonium thermophilum TaxID=223376 RepID=A0ABR3XNL5_9PEZI
MAVAGKVVSKRSARPFVEDGMERQTYEPQPKKSTLARHDEILQEDADSPSSSLSLSSQGSLDMAASDFMELAKFGAGMKITGVTGREALDRKSCQDGGGKASTEAQPFTFPADLVTSAHDQELPRHHRPVNFGVVVPGVYRSSYPQPEDYDFIKELGLKTIITLVHKDLPPGYKDFIASNGIRHYVFDMKGTKKEEIPAKTMKSILRLVLDQQNHPLLIHCNHGKHRTGCVVAVVRKLTGWESSTIIDEYKSYAEPKVRECDIKYINTFDLSTISNLFGRESSWHFRLRSFFRISLVTTIVLLLWFFSGNRIASQSKPY